MSDPSMWTWTDNRKLTEYNVGWSQALIDARDYWIRLVDEGKFSAFEAMARAVKRNIAISRRAWKDSSGLMLGHSKPEVFVQSRDKDTCTLWFDAESLRYPNEYSLKLLLHTFFGIDVAHLFRWVVLTAPAPKPAYASSDPRTIHPLTNRDDYPAMSLRTLTEAERYAGLEWLRPTSISYRPETKEWVDMHTVHGGACFQIPMHDIHHPKVEFYTEEIDALATYANALIAIQGQTSGVADDELLIRMLTDTSLWKNREARKHLRAMTYPERYLRLALAEHFKVCRIERRSFMDLQNISRMVHICNGWGVAPIAEYPRAGE